MPTQQTGQMPAVVAEEYDRSGFRIILKPQDQLFVPRLVDFVDIPLGLR